MFERFTDRARRVLVLAQEEARLLGHNVMGTEHLLLGLLHEGEGVAASVLESLGISLEPARQKVGEVVGSEAGGPVESPPFSRPAKKVLELSLREALQIGHDHIGTEHILLGLIREGDGTGARVLVDMGLDLAQVRYRVIQALSHRPGVGDMGTDDSASSSRGPRLHAGRPGPIQASDSRLWRSAGMVGRGGGTAGSPRTVHSVAGTVELAYEGVRLTGNVGGHGVDVVLDVPKHEGRAEGIFAGSNVSANWKLADSSDWPGAAPASLSGLFGGERAELLVWFHFYPSLHFDHCTVEGEVAGRPVSVYIQQGDPAGDTGTFTAHGIFAGSDFSIHGFIPCGHDGYVEGAVLGRPVQLRAKPEQGSSAPATITGTYDGPSSLLLLLSSATHFFM